MSLCDYAENEILDHVFSKATWTAPDTLYFGLATGVTDAGVVTGEPSGNNYSRASITNNSTNFPAASGGVKKNNTSITFPTPSGTWGTMTHIFISDAATGGNMIGYQGLTCPKTIVSGVAPTFYPNGLEITLD